MAEYMNHFVSKGVQNRTNSNIMTWWMTNFNMPVPDITDATAWTEGYGPVTYDSAGTSFDLSSFSPGFEVALFSTIWHWEDPTNGTGTLHQRWLYPDGSTMYDCLNGFSVPINTPVGGWTEYWYSCNQGIAGWEINASGNYEVESWSTGDGALASTKTTITLSNVPSTSQLGTSKAGYIWIEGNDLCFINANEWKHTIIGTDLGYVDSNKTGYMWIDNLDDLHWIGGNGNKYRVPWKIQQFASTFSNGPTGETYAGTDKEGYMWVDNEFGYTHLSYIGHNGYKFLVGAGHYPYQVAY